MIIIGSEMVTVSVFFLFFLANQFKETSKIQRLLYTERENLTNSRWGRIRSRGKI